MQHTDNEATVDREPYGLHRLHRRPLARRTVEPSDARGHQRPCIAKSLRVAINSLDGTTWAGAQRPSISGQSCASARLRVARLDTSWAVFRMSSQANEIRQIHLIVVPQTADDPRTSPPACGRRGLGTSSIPTGLVRPA